jgi:hypothetical protein
MYAFILGSLGSVKMVGLAVVYQLARMEKSSINPWLHRLGFIKALIDTYRHVLSLTTEAAGGPFECRFAKPRGYLSCLV